jgi:hypothetical protein
VRGVTSDGRVIEVAMERHQTLAPGQWTSGWKDLVDDPDHPAITRDVAMPTTFNLAPLPARHFCSGHMYWEQQATQPRDCASVHTTFVEGGNLGKVWRFRECVRLSFEPSPMAAYARTPWQCVVCPRWLPRRVGIARTSPQPCSQRAPLPNLAPALLATGTTPASHSCWLAEA